MNLPAVICDLDGTLVDSYEGIAEALRMACQNANVELARAIDRWIVGPTLDDILLQILTRADQKAFAAVRAAFIAQYDNNFCILSSPFPGVRDMLAGLSQAGYALALATNKRLLPTTNILEALNWQHYFGAVATPDSQAGNSRSKTKMLLDLRSKVGTNAFYLGDTMADSVCAAEAGVSFILAHWAGNGTPASASAVVAQSPLEVLGILDKMTRQPNGW